MILKVLTLTLTDGLYALSGSCARGRLCMEGICPGTENEQLDTWMNGSSGAGASHPLGK